MEEYKSRKDVPQNYKWDLSDFYESAKQWQDSYKNIESAILKLENYKDKIYDAEKLEEYLNLYMDTRCELLNLYVYAYLNHDVELSDTKYISMLEKASSMYTKFNAAIAFFEPQLLTIQEDKFNELFIKNQNLDKYKIFLEDIYDKRKHTLSEKEEKLICSLTDTYDSYSNISSSLLNSENDYGTITTSEGKTVNILLNNLRKLKQDKDENIRKRANKKFFKVIEQYQNTEAALLNNFVKNNIIVSKIHNYQSAWDKTLKDDKLTDKIFKSLQNACEKKLDVNKKFYKLMKKALNINTLHAYDTSMKWNIKELEYSIEDAENIVLNSLNILGEDYKNKLKKIFDNHYIDYCGYKGKASGGYSYSTYDKNSRILMSFRGMFDDISTIAHESGHNVHHQFINENNNSWYGNQIRIISEVASLTNEFLLANYMIKNGKSKEEKLIGLENIIKVYQSNFFGAIMEGQLEVKMYEKSENGGTITAEFLNDETSKLLNKYQGNTVSRNKYTKLMWAIRSHYYMVFYLFSYAISVSVAANVASRIINCEEGILDKYYKFLKTGTDVNPIDTYKILDIDIESEDIYLKGIEYFNEQLDNYERILGGGN